MACVKVPHLLPVVVLAVALDCATAAEKGDTKETRAGGTTTRPAPPGDARSAPAGRDAENSKPIKIATSEDYDAFVIAWILPLLKEEKFEQAFALAERAIVENPSLDERCKSEVLWMIAEVKAVLTEDKDFALRFSEKLARRFPSAATKEVRQALEKSVLTAIEERKEILGRDRKDEFSPPE